MNQLLYTLKLEVIGDDRRAFFRALQSRYGAPTRAFSHLLPPRQWVARITGRCETYGLQREFVRGQVDYRDADDVGSRGVYAYYQLPPGVYEVNELLDHRSGRRYFVRVEELQLSEISREEVLAWLDARHS